MSWSRVLRRKSPCRTLPHKAYFLGFLGGKERNWKPVAQIRASLVLSCPFSFRLRRKRKVTHFISPAWKIIREQANCRAPRSLEPATTALIWVQWVCLFCPARQSVLFFERGPLCAAYSSFELTMHLDANFTTLSIPAWLSLLSDQLCLSYRLRHHTYLNSRSSRSLLFFSFISNLNISPNSLCILPNFTSQSLTAGLSECIIMELSEWAAK